jgi:hypothetical protein
MEKGILAVKEIEILGILCHKAQWKNVLTERRGDKEFDIDIFVENGIDSMKKISSYMPLAIIWNVNWEDKRIWGLTDAYGDKGCIPSQGYDWSGVRDSSPESIWEMTDVAVKMLEKEDSYEKKTVGEVIRMMTMFSNCKTRAELMDCAAKRKDFFMLRMAEMYAILKGMK